MRLICCMCNIVLVFCLWSYILYVFDLRRLCFLFKQNIHIISVHNIFTMCLVFFLSLANYVQFILYVNILTDILKLVFGMLFMFV